MDIEFVRNKFKKIENLLSDKAWFKKDEWLISTHSFPRKNATGITFHIFKSHWFNENSNGIHIESYLDFNPKKQRKAYLTIHFLHDDFIPDTKIKRIDLTKPIIDKIYDTVACWPGYKFRVGKYGQQPFTYSIDGTSVEFENVLIKEATKLCKLLGPLIDEQLLNLL